MSLNSVGLRRLCITACALLFTVGRAPGQHVPRIMLLGEPTQVDMAPGSGAITRISHGPSGTVLEAPEGMAENFRLALQKPDKTMVTVLGKDQKLSSENKAPDGKILSLRWDGPLKDTSGEAHDIAVRMDVAIAGDSVEFTLHVENKTAHKVREAWYPIIGGLTGFHPQGKPSDAKIWVPTSKPWEKPAALPFGTAEFAYPGQMNMSFCCIENETMGRSLYFSSQDAVARYKTYDFMELDGPAGAKDLFGCVKHYPFTPPGGEFDGSTVVLRFVPGNWRAAGQVYREWFKKTFGIAQPSDSWVRRESFFLMTMFMLPEGTINFTFKDIPKWAKAAKEHGINAVQISGWQQGGHDNGYPDYTPDPRLGTWKELEDGIRECHKMGVKVYFFVNYQPVMLESDWYKKELQKYREMKEDGGLTWNAGWGMGTLWARMDHPKKMTWADPAFPQFRKIIVDQFEKLAAIGGDGVHVDKMFPTAIEYNPDAPGSPDTATWEGAITLTKEIMAACRKHQPDWAMSFECNWDRMLQFGGATWWVGNQLITRQVFPENAETLGLYDAYNYLCVNNAVRGGHIIMVAPLSFCRNVDWPPFHDLAHYIKEVKRIRDALQETVFYGEVRGHEGVKVEGEPSDGIEYSVFRNRETGRRVCIVTNKNMTAGNLPIAGFDGGAGGAAKVHEPFKKVKKVHLPATIEIPAERIVFVEETEGRPAKSETNTALATAAISAVEKAQTKTIPANGNFESGGFDGWTADPCWVVADDSRGYYGGWQGKYWAWSGGKGEAATGVLKSEPFVLDNDAVRLLIAGWNSIEGSGKPRKWNYVTLNLADGTELDRVYAPNTTTFVPVYLDGSAHKGEKVYVQAVDDADQATYSMLCVDDVRTASLPGDLKKPVPSLPAFSKKRSIQLENEKYSIEVSRANGSLTRVRDKKGDLELVLEPRLGGAYKFTLPIPGKEPWQTIEANWIFGHEQKLSSHQSADGKLTLNWTGPLRNYLGETYDLSVTETIELARGGILFNLSIENSTALPVGETYFPMVGGIQGLGKTRGQMKGTQLVRPGADGSFATDDIFRVFKNFWWLGDHGPEMFFSYPESQPEPWMGFDCPKIGRSVCVGALDPSNRKMVIRLELLPSSSGPAIMVGDPSAVFGGVREDGNWPRVGELRGQPAGVELSFVEFANCPAGQTYKAAPAFLEFVSGGGQEMRKTYAAWKTGK